MFWISEAVTIHDRIIRELWLKVIEFIGLQISATEGARSGLLRAAITSAIGDETKNLNNRT
jgi:hypothetical protein